MSVSKKRILFSSEFSALATGYSVYALEILSRLHKTGRFELAELASYGSPSDPRAGKIPWTYLPAAPDEHDAEGMREYNSRPTNQFGAWKFEEACLRFRPDVVVGYRDPWMDSHLFSSPFRRFYHLAIMPTVDSVPLHDAWLADILTADGVFAYCDWGLEQLVRQGGGGVRAVCPTPPGADLEIFRPVPDKKAHRRSLGMDPDAFVVGTAQRNQSRKLFPDLVAGFARAIREANPELARKMYLYLHTCHPDIGWDIPRLIREAGLGHRTFFTYACKTCGAAFPSLYQDVRGVCRVCGKASAILPGSLAGVTQEFLAKVYNLWDCHVQFAQCEGLGMTSVEAAACGVPVFGVDYSAMSDVVRKTNGMPVKVQRYFRDAGTHAVRAYPDNGDFANKLVCFLRSPQEVKNRLSFLAREGVEKHFNYEKTARVWGDYFDSLELPSHEQTWLSPTRQHQPVLQVPGSMSEELFARWGMVNLAGRPDLANSYRASRMARELHWGCTQTNTGGLTFGEASLLGANPRMVSFNRDMAVGELLELCRERNHWEGKREEMIRGR